MQGALTDLFPVHATYARLKCDYTLVHVLRVILNQEYVSALRIDKLFIVPEMIRLQYSNESIQSNKHPDPESFVM